MSANVENDSIRNSIEHKISIRYAPNAPAPWDENKQVETLEVKHPDAQRVSSWVNKLEKLGWCVWIEGTHEGTPAALLTKPGLRL